ncbi:hypothetical protein [Piscinibacter gummiphilus]|uniref:Uncharacterized protein n=1 Tax=Piscinibacter gummiphilus TaxID=946333 RepID=A0A1W6LC60_9BURK|nr:hypothetical protein [Piscinibacter gummiphilus]ARN21830.1 hypothetical protein A4W93_19080 [Piscinibacter gummiphilus]ATU66517.1 hypothetical protein CPZ87_19170 [Piscinibacter gummiphilus]GLS93883.1 hypothetical protein GCM10007918_11750 [Piscinibacter gummiphilus]
MPVSRALADTLAILHALLVAALLMSAAYVWHLRCEGFGCTGIGVAWFAWAVIFLLVSVLGFGAGRLARARPLARQVVRWGLRVQLAVGAVLLVVWVSHQVA